MFELILFFILKGLLVLVPHLGFFCLGWIVRGAVASRKPTELPERPGAQNVTPEEGQTNG